MDTGDPVGRRPTVIAIDGPAGAGKSTVTRAVAERLGILYLDTGAMYRAATWGLLQAGLDLDDPAAVATWVQARQIDFDEQGAVRLDGVAPGSSIRSPEVTSAIWRVADHPACREHLVGLQRAILGNRDAALEGRDTTTVICPDATLKVYLDASPEERARRRLLDWAGPESPAFEAVVQAIRERDARDSGRVVGALRLADDAVAIVTDGEATEAVIARILALAVQRRPLLLERSVADQVLVGRSRQAGYQRVAQGSIADPPAPWQLGISNPVPDRMPAGLRDLSRNSGGRQAGILIQGRAVVILGGRGETPGRILALPMLPQTWYVIEPGAWHAVVQLPGTIAAWAEASGIRETRHALDEEQLAALSGFLAIYLPEGH